MKVEYRCEGCGKRWPEAARAERCEKSHGVAGTLVATTPEAVPELLRAARQKAEKTQQAIADTMGIGRSMACHYESGRNTPSIDTLSKWADACGMNVEIRMVPR